jgi:hypothetical protein
MRVHESEEARRRRYLWIAVVALGTLVVALNAYRVLSIRHGDPDQFWHIETGRWIVAHHAVPLTDPFSWYGSARQARWIAHEWLFGVLSYGLYAAGGFRMLYAFTALLDGLLFLLAYTYTYLRSKRRALSLGIAALIIAGTLPNLAPRPQMLTFCALLTIGILGEKGKLFWALPIVLLAANYHGAAYPIYLIVLAFYAIPAQPLALLAAVPLVLLNPNGKALLSYALGVVNPDAGFINEFAPTALVKRPMDFAVYLGTMVVLWGTRFKLKDGLMAFALIMLSLSAVRQIAFFYILVLPILSTYVPGEPDPEPAEEHDPAPEFGRLLPARGAFGVFDLAPPLMMAMVLAVTAGAALRAPLNVNDGYPSGAVAYIKRHGITHVFNVWGDGGYLIHNGVPTLIDGRGDPFMAAGNHGVDMAHDYLTTLSTQRDPRRFLDDYGIRYLLLKRGMSYHQALKHDPRISVVYEDDGYVLLQYDRGHQRMWRTPALQ